MNAQTKFRTALTCRSRCRDIFVLYISANNNKTRSLFLPKKKSDEDNNSKIRVFLIRSYHICFIPLVLHLVKQTFC